MGRKELKIFIQFYKTVNILQLIFGEIALHSFSLFLILNTSAVNTQENI
jgi:hypothetical protein